MEVNSTTISHNKIKELIDLTQHENLQIYKIPSTKIRYGDGKEYINFSTEQERLNFLLQGSMFLSLATSFTIEAALANIPILQIILNEKLEQDESILEIAKRINLSDHITRYYNTSFENVLNMDDLKKKITQLHKNQNLNHLEQKNNDFKLRIGTQHLKPELL